jgi:hypothetical protein
MNFGFIALARTYGLSAQQMDAMWSMIQYDAPWDSPSYGLERFEHVARTFGFIE